MLRARWGRENRIAVPLTVAATVVTVALSGCSSSKKDPGGSGSSSAAAGSDSSAAATGGSVNIVAYSVPKPAYDALSTGFQGTSTGKGVTFAASYGASGTQSQAVANGQKADFVNFSVGSDMTKLVPDFVDSGWDSGPTKGIISDSVVVIVVRPGNPKHITGWDDLTQPGLKIVTPDPASSGSAKWNILAAYTHVLEDGGTEDQAQDYLKKFYAN
ncbi:MAG: substrate-binding domain-containing protein, partial [Actinobacteria bacterium]|nr:substrate-binding domain-containing protein [Actinomycetota bacterium]